jgi:hypothetical protein
MSIDSPLAVENSKKALFLGLFWYWELKELI